MNQLPSPSTLSNAPAVGHRDAPSRPPRYRVAVVSAGWHRDIVGKAVAAIEAELSAPAVAPVELARFDVPGAFEIPLHAKRLARTGRYDGLIACALVANGGIYRHEFVASAVIDGLMRVQLETDVPVFSCVLTPRDFHEHEEHRRFFAEHFVKKGQEVAHACLATLDALARWPGGAGSRPGAQSAA